MKRSLLMLLAALLLGLQACTVKTPEERRRLTRPRPAPPPPEEIVAAPEEPPGEEAPPPAEEKPEAAQILRADGTRIVDADGNTVVLKGCNLGNWLLLEMWMLDLKDIRDQYEFEQILANRFSRAEMERLMDRYRRNWIAARDFPIIRSFGFNTVRLPFNYRLLVDDDRPFQLRDDAFEWLDRAVKLCERAGLYLILDLHGAPGGQSSDHTTGRAGQNKLWGSEKERRLMAWIWRKIAEHYRNSATVAAYDLVNEPYGASPEQLTLLMDEVYRAIRAVDTRHIVFMPGLHQGVEFYGPPAERGWENVGFTEHHYPGLFGGDPSLETHARFLYRHIPYRRSYLERMQVPFLVGEFNVVFQHVGGAALMRAYYDTYAAMGWGATLWCYKLLTRAGGPHEDSWSMVKNKSAMPAFSPKTATLAEIESWIDGLGNMDYSFYENLGAALTMAEPPPVALPERPVLPVKPPASDPVSPWRVTDLNGALPGGQKALPGAALDVYGGGADIWSTEDQFRYVWQPVTGDFEFSAVVTNLVYSHEYAKAGLMIRSDLDGNAAHVAILAFPEGQVGISSRHAKGAVLQEKMFTTGGFPLRLKLRRKGNTIETAFAGPDMAWQKKSMHAPQAIGHNCYVGFAVLSHDNKCLTTASFREIGLVTTAPGWTP